jgi:hypothetical protein
MMLVRFATLWFAVAVGFVALGILRATRPGLTGEEASAAAVPGPSAPGAAAPSAGAIGEADANTP